MKKITTYLVFIAVAATLASCSTTRRLGKDQVLYTGVTDIKIESVDGRRVPGSVRANIREPLSVRPNNPLWSPYLRTPLPTGLWVWNYMYTERKTGFKAWVYRTFGRQPVLMEQVQPEARERMVEDILDNLGYFGSSAHSELHPNRRNPKKARVGYRVEVAKPWFYETVEFPSVRDTATVEIAALQRSSNLKPGQQYNIDTLTRERIRIANSLRNHSFYYFRPDYIEYFADTTRVRYGVDLKMRMAAGIPPAGLRPYDVGDIRITLFSADSRGEMDSLNLETGKLVYQKPLKIRPKVLQRAFTFRTGDPARVSQIDLTLTKFNRIGVFRYVNLEVTPLDSLKLGDRLDMNFTAAFDTPMDAEIEADLAYKSTSFLGPALTAGIKHKNIFKGGETFSVALNGSYEWNTGNNRSAENSTAINSYEFGITTSLAIPRLIVPRFIDRAIDHGGTTSYALSANLLNRPTLFTMFSAAFSNTYDFRTSHTVTHSFTPFRMVFNRLTRRTARFDEMLSGNEALALSFQDQFIPSGSYTYTFDTRLGRMGRDRFVWQVTLTSAGNVWAGIYNLLGAGDRKTIFGLPFSQFFKETTEFRYFKRVARVNTLAIRLFVGAGHPFGNSAVLPFTEQFFIGGAYSIRAFTIRSIGPGSFRDPEWSYLDRAGEFKFELNTEMRFLIKGNLHGAVFLDTGNVWLLHDDPNRPGGKLGSGNFFRQLALGTGFGLRYDLGFIVIRADLGIGLRLPYDTGRKGFYNIPRFADGLGFHLAIGYPF